MERSANYFVVGVFVSISLLALVGFSIWLAGMHDFGGHDRYTIYFTEPVSGLNEDGVVKYKGVEVGKIVEMRIDPNKSDLVKVDIEVKDETPIRAGTTATVQIQGITGQSYLELTTASNDDNPPRVVADEKYPVLAGRGNQFAKFLDDLPKVSKQLEATLSGVDQLAKESRKMLPNVDKRLETALSGINELSKEGTKTAGSIRGLADKLKDDPSQILSPPPQRGVAIPK